MLFIIYLLPVITLKDDYFYAQLTILFLAERRKPGAYSFVARRNPLVSEPW